MHRVEVVYVNGMDTPHPGFTRTLVYSFPAEQIAKDFVDKVNAMPHTAHHSKATAKLQETDKGEY